MRLIQLMLWSIMIYFGYKVIRQAIQSKAGTTVKGRPKKKSLNIDESQIEDGDYEDIEDKE